MIITRYSKQRLAELNLEVEFLTPTFLGGADQNAELRAAPFKNLLRQWWRVACGRQFPSWREMQQAEGELFGSVQEGRTKASNVRVSISAHKNNIGFSDAVMDLGKTFHPEVGTNGMKIDNDLYLGFGPIIKERKQPKRWKSYITPESRANLTITCPQQHKNTIDNVLQYIHSFGTIGSRSRNGWGSMAISGQDFEPRSLADFPRKPFTDLLNKTEYPISLCKDDKLLCWQVRPRQHGSWQALMTALAEIYMNLRTAINIKPQGLKERHILGYPVTNHSVGSWGGNNGRMPSQLRLMVKRNTEGKLVGRILHLAHKLPKRWDTQLGSELSVWQSIHRKLDANNQLQRAGGNQ